MPAFLSLTFSPHPSFLLINSSNDDDPHLCISIRISFQLSRARPRCVRDFATAVESPLTVYWLSARADGVMYGTRPESANASRSNSRANSPSRGRSPAAVNVDGEDGNRGSSSRSRSRLGKAVSAVFGSHGHQDLSFADEKGLERQARDTNSRNASRNASRHASRANSPSRAPIVEEEIGTAGTAEEQQRGRLESALRDTSAPTNGNGAHYQAEEQPKSRSTSRARLSDAVKKVFSPHGAPQDLSFADEKGLERQARESSRSRPGSKSASRAGSRSASRVRGADIPEEGTMSTGAGHYGAVRS